MIDKNYKGIALVKVYGLYCKKDGNDNVVMVTKCKQSESKFVTILAEKMSNLLSLRLWIVKLIKWFHQIQEIVSFTNALFVQKLIILPLV